MKNDIGGRRRAASWVLQGIVAVVLFQTLFFKFTAAEESVYIFSTLGMEPWGRIGSGVVELIACALILAPRTVAWGALLALGVISGAIVSHLTKLGVVVQNDGGLLFVLALTVFGCSTAILALRRAELGAIWRKVHACPKNASGKG
ncbi:MAG: DoxX family protein [Planctomycetes bacterium]|nr:DoxX family protein [Planctomycetota bacterium]